MEETIFFIETEKIVPNPYQPRREFDGEALRELGESIREYGVLEPLIVTRKQTETETGIIVSYELVAGERRLRAAQLIGIRAVPAIVKDLSEKAKLEIALIENVQRENLNAVERARAFARLMDEFNLTQLEIANRVHKSRAYVANTLRLLKLPDDIQAAIAAGKVTEAHARFILAVDDAELQKQLFQRILSEGLTIRETKAFIQQRTTPEKENIAPEFSLLREKLEEILNARVEVKPRESGAELRINFGSLEELLNLIEGIVASKRRNESPVPEAEPTHHEELQ